MQELGGASPSRDIILKLGLALGDSQGLYSPKCPSPNKRLGCLLGLRLGL